MLGSGKVQCSHAVYVLVHYSHLFHLEKGHHRVELVGIEGVADRGTEHVAGIHSQ